MIGIDIMLMMLMVMMTKTAIILVTMLITVVGMMNIVGMVMNKMETVAEAIETNRGGSPNAGERVARGRR